MIQSKKHELNFKRPKRGVLELNLLPKHAILWINIILKSIDLFWKFTNEICALKHLIFVIVSLWTLSVI